MGHGYAMTNGGVCLHAMIFEMLPPGYDKTLSIDHIVPENKLDNREHNLRLATRGEQAFNKAKRKNCASKYVGVSKTGMCWQARVTTRRPIILAFLKPRKKLGQLHRRKRRSFMARMFHISKELLYM